MYQGWGLWQEGFSVFPAGFDVAEFAFAQDAGTSQLVSRFLTKGIDPCDAVEPLFLWRKGEFRLPIPPSC